MVLLRDPKRLPGIGRAHVVILPQGRAGVLIAHANQQLASSRALDVYVIAKTYTERWVMQV
ncbi:MAG TPA: hypothetical protein VF970_14115 [Gemmatimonadales bacterium]